MSTTNIKPTRSGRKPRKSREVIESEASQRLQHPSFADVSDASSGEESEDQSDEWRPPPVSPSTAKDDPITEKKDVYEVDWMGPATNRNKYSLGPVHQDFIQNHQQFRSKGSGPNIKWLATSFSNLPRWIRSATTKYLDSEATKVGCLAPMHLFWIFMDKLEILKYVPKWSNGRMKLFFHHEPDEHRNMRKM